MASDKSKVDNEKCMVVQFPNMDNKAAVSFQSWLVDSKTTSILEQVIKDGTLVKIFWPFDVPIQSASYMNKSLKKLTDNQWETRVVRILSFGDWTKMCKQLKNFQQFDVISPKKVERKSLKKVVSVKKEKVSAVSTARKERRKKSAALQKKKDVASRNLRKPLVPKVKMLEISSIIDMSEEESSAAIKSKEFIRAEPTISAQKSETTDKYEKSSKNSVSFTETKKDDFDAELKTTPKKPDFIGQEDITLDSKTLFGEKDCDNPLIATLSESSNKEMGLDSERKIDDDERILNDRDQRHLNLLVNLSPDGKSLDEVKSSPSTKNLDHHAASYQSDSLKSDGGSKIHINTVTDVTQSRSTLDSTMVPSVKSAETVCDPLKSSDANSTNFKKKELFKSPSYTDTDEESASMSSDDEEPYSSKTRTRSYDQLVSTIRSTKYRLRLLEKRNEELEINLAAAKRLSTLDKKCDEILEKFSLIEESIEEENEKFLASAARTNKLLNTLSHKAEIIMRSLEKHGLLDLEAKAFDDNSSDDKKTIALEGCHEKLNQHSYSADLEKSSSENFHESGENSSGNNNEKIEKALLSKENRKSKSSVKMEEPKQKKPRFDVNTESEMHSSKQTDEPKERADKNLEDDSEEESEKKFEGKPEEKISSRKSKVLTDDSGQELPKTVLGEGVSIYTTQLRDSNNLGNFNGEVNYLLNILFDTEDFKICTLSGRKVMKKTENGEKINVETRKLDPAMIKAIEGHVLKRYPDKSKKDFKKIVANKCKNYGR